MFCCRHGLKYEKSFEPNAVVADFEDKGFVGDVSKLVEFSKNATHLKLFDTELTIYSSRADKLKLLYCLFL